MTSYKLSRNIKSTLIDVDNEVTALLRILDREIGEYDKFSLDLILREALNNAVIHGNQNDPDLVIFLSIMLIGKWFHIRIEDQGEGFDWSSKIHVREVKAEAEHGRGLPIIFHYGEGVQLNEKGNKISFKLARYAGV